MQTTQSKVQLVIIVALLGALVFLAGRNGACAIDFFGNLAGSQGGMLQRGDTAPGFTLIDLDGEPQSSEQFAGKALVVNFWATWCGPCREHTPELVDLQQAFASQGIQFIGISLDRGESATIAEFRDAMNIPYPILRGDEAVVEAFGGISAIPTTFIINADGKVAASYVGVIPKADFKAVLESVAPGEQPNGIAAL